MIRLKVILVLLALECAFGPGVQKGLTKPLPTFSRDIAPIVFGHCTSCHHPGGSGPFSLLRYDDVRQRASQIAAVTASRYMPPWLPEPGYGRFAGDLRLGAAEIELFRQWAENGAAEGDPKDLPRAPQYNEGWQFGKPDLVLRMPDAYTLAAAGEDVFRNFVIPIPATAVTSTRYVRALEILPGNKRIVHHANIIIDRSGEARRRDAEDPDVGFAGMDINIATSSFEPESHFLFWKPGTSEWSEPEGMAWRLDKGTDMVLNMHLQPSGKTEPVQASIGLYFTEKPPVNFPMLLQLERDGALNIPPGARDFAITDELRLPIDVDLLAVYPHAHYLGKEMKAWATTPSGERHWIIWIKDWDINWQAVYRYEKPLHLPRGTVITMRYTYDNSSANPRNPSRPPRRVKAGNRSVDEMGHLWIQVLPKPGAPRANEKGDPRLALQKAAMEARLSKYPGDFTAHFNLGAALASEGRQPQAIFHYREALKAKPRDVVTLQSLGAALQESGKTDDAVQCYRQVLSIAPDYADAHYNLGNVLLERGLFAEAIAHLKEVIRLSPDDAGAYNSLGSAYGMQGRLDEAIAYFEKALKIDPNHAQARENLQKARRR